jgi:hypothetical protein
VAATLVDTGFLVALFRHREHHNAAARAWLAGHRGALATTTPVMVEAAFFLDAAQKRAMLEWVRRGAMRVVEWPVEAYVATAGIIGKYADRDIDLADAALVWLAGETGDCAILTVDVRDFSVYRLPGGKRFEILPWRQTA